MSYWKIYEMALWKGESCDNIDYIFLTYLDLCASTAYFVSGYLLRFFFTQSLTGVTHMPIWAGASQKGA